MPAEYTVGQLFFETAEKHPQLLAQKDVYHQPHIEFTYSQMADEVRRFGAGLLSLGIQPGEKIALFGDSQARWLICDVAMLSIGAVDVPRGSDSATPEFEYILEHSDAIAAIIQDKRLFERLSNLTNSLKKLRFVVIMDDSTAQLKGVEGLVINDFSQVASAGQDHLQAFEQVRQRIKPCDLATIVYTSGTTGTPKGVMLSHRNLTHQALYLKPWLNVEPGDILMCILPPWHAYERAAEYLGTRNATTLYYTTKRHFREDMQKIAPRLLPCVPRMWEMVYETIYEKVSKEPPPRQKLFHRLVKASEKYVMARRIAYRLDARKTSAGFGERLVAALKMLAHWPAHRLGDKLIYSKLRAVTGGKLKAAVSGGGSLAPYIDLFFEIVGITIVNGYGLTETAPVLALRPVWRNVRGTVGSPLTDTELQIRDESGNPLPQGSTGIIWARGPGVMIGYYKNKEASRSIIDSQGWLNTGDLGYITSTGDLAITGRAKDTIVLASGENVEPEPIESVARKSPLVSQIIVVGQDQRTLGALVIPNAAKLAEVLGRPPETLIADLCVVPAAPKIVRDDIARAMKSDGGFRTHEQITRVVLLPEPFTEANGLLTQTMKLRRNIIAKAHEEDIARMFAS